MDGFHGNVAIQESKKKDAIERCGIQPAGKYYCPAYNTKGECRNYRYQSFQQDYPALEIILLMMVRKTVRLRNKRSINDHPW